MSDKLGSFILKTEHDQELRIEFDDRIPFAPFQQIIRAFADYLDKDQKVRKLIVTIDAERGGRAT